MLGFAFRSERLAHCRQTKPAEAIKIDSMTAAKLPPLDQALMTTSMKTIVQRSSAPALKTAAVMKASVSPTASSAASRSFSWNQPVRGRERSPTTRFPSGIANREREKDQRTSVLAILKTAGFEGKKSRTRALAPGLFELGERDDAVDVDVGVGEELVDGGLVYAVRV